MEHNITATWPGWEIVSCIGSGNSGTVYEIRRNTRTEVEKAALKIISIPQNMNELEELYENGHDRDSLAAHFNEQREQIVREYRTISELQGGSNLVAIDDVRSVPHSDGVGWDIHIKMELLTPILKMTGDATAEEEAIKLGMHICNALNACRERGIEHYDIKPSNIFISRDGYYKLGDHGLGKYASSSQNRANVGVVRFMPPEYYLGQPYGAGADTYMLGLVMYWMLNKHRGPFLPLPPQRSSLQQESESMRRIVSGEPLPRPAVGSERLHGIVLKACAFAAENRYQTPAQMLAELTEVNRDAVSDGVIRGVMSNVIGTGAVYLGKDDPEEENINNMTFNMFNPMQPTQEINEATIRVESRHPQPAPQPQPVPQPKQRKEKSNTGKIVLIIAAILLVLALTFGTITVLAVVGVFDGIFFEDRDDRDDPGQDGDQDGGNTGAGTTDPGTVSWSEWGSELPGFVFEGHYAIQTALQYRSAPMYCFEGAVENEDEYTVCYTGYTDWGDPGEWQSEPIEESELVQVEVGAKYRYRDLYSYKYCEGFVTKTGYAWGEWKYSDTPVTARSGREIEEIPIYRSRTRLITYYCAKNGEWSEWTDEVLHPTQITVVNTRVMYRYAKREAPVASMKNFPETITRYVSRFVDVPNDSWYGANTENWVGTAVELGAMSANEYLCFRPTERVTVAEVIKAAVALRLVYNGRAAVLSESSPWYQSYVNYAIEQGIINRGDFSDYNKEATREEAAYILCRALPEEEVTGTNLVTAILDMTPSSKYYMSVYQLAQAGVISWTEPEGNFKPQDLITRAEIAAMLSRIAYPHKRIVSNVQ